MPAIIWPDDLSVVRDTHAYPYILLGIALLIALGFEFVNGFHDTANAVATVIYTHSMSPNLAVVWSGAFNFLGVLVSTGAVAFSIVSLLPVELILQVGSGAGFAMRISLSLAIADCSDPVESRHLVVRATLLQFPYPHRFHHRCGPDESIDGGQWIRHQRR